MKAIILTYDRNAILTEHMIQCYNELWPDHPFTFRIPYQELERIQSGARREYVKTPKDIKNTVLTLLEGIDDEEWIYWCIDDKYPVQLHVQQIEEIYQSILNHKLGEISTVLFCRARRMLDPKYLTGERIMLNNEALLERNAYHQIWIHQFTKVKVIRHLFLNFPDNIAQANIMDPLKDKIRKPATHKLYVTEINHSIFAESSYTGIITGNCFESLKKHNITVPSWFTINQDVSTYISKL